MAVFSYLNPDNIFIKYKDSKRYTEVLTRPFPDFDRLARNRPAAGIDPAYPKTTDGTTASIIRKTPRRIVQQLPTGSIVAHDNGWLGVVAEYIFNERIIREANEDYDLIQKSWLVIEKGLTFGSCATYTPFMNHNGMFTPDLTLPYWGDIMIQKGKKSGSSSSYIFMRSWWQPEDIEALIDSESKLATEAKKRKAKYEPTWDAEALKSVLKAETAKDAIAMTPDEKERGLESNGVELVTAFQKGVGAKFYTFNPTTQTIVRTKINKDPRGKTPINWFYGDIDGNNPLGRGIIELIGGLQNLIDSDMQMYQYNRALLLAPPVIKYGNIGNFRYAPNAVLRAKSPTDNIKALDIDNSAIAAYPALYGMQKSQLLNLVNSPDTSISATVGNPGFSKTPAGINQQSQNISVDDNYIDKMFDAWFQDWAETAINLYFAERSGIEELQLDKVTASKLRQLPKFDQSLLSEDNKIMINYDTATPALKFRVDPSTTKTKDSATQVQAASNLLDMVMKYPMLNANFGGPIDVDVLSRRIVTNSGVADPEQVAPMPTEAQIQSKEQQKNQVNPFSPMFDKPKLTIDFPDLPPAAQLQMLNSAGIHITAQDIMQGPVLDPNTRGNMAVDPMNVPGISLPGGGSSTSSNPAQVDIGDIYKTTTDPQVKAQIEAMAGLNPNPTHVQNQVDTNAVSHMNQQVTGITGAAQAIAPPQPPQTAQPAPTAQTAPTTPTPQPQAPQAPQQPDPQETPQQELQEPQSQQAGEMNPLDMQLIQHLKALNIPDQLIAKAIQMAEQGATPQQILQAIGVSSGKR